MLVSKQVASGWQIAFAALAFCALACLVFCGLGCDAKKSHDGLEIYVIPKGTTHTFWRMIEAGARKAEKELNAAGTRVKVHWKGPLKEDDTQDQIDLVKTMISLQIDGICLAPLDKSALVGPVRTLGQAEIPVVVFDSGLDAPVGEVFASYVATDNYKGGVMGARRLGDILGGKGKIILLRYMVGSESTEQREAGFLDTIKKDFPGIELISSDERAGATEEEAFQKSQNLLTLHRDVVEGIFCPNESAVAGMMDALKKAGLAGKVKLVGFDSSDKLIRGLKDGHIQGLVLQDPINMAYLSVMVLVKYLKGETIEPRVDTGVYVVTPDNMNEPEMKQLHSPDLSQWLGK